MRLGLKVVLILLLILLLLCLGWFWWRKHQGPPVGGTASADCIDRAEAMVAKWKSEGKSPELIDKLFQAEIAKCNGVTGSCAAMIGAANADYAWLGRAVLSGAMPPAEYLARVRDRSRKLRESRKDPSICDAVAKGDSDGDLVPDDRDRCPQTPSLAPTDANGCPDTSPLPPAPTPEAVQRAADALKIPVSKACVDAPAPHVSSVLKAGIAPDAQSFLILVSKVDNQPPACPLFYEVDILIRTGSFFSGRNNTTQFHRVFRPSDAISVPPGRPTGLTFRLLQSDPTVPWRELTFHRVEPSDRSDRYFRVRTANGNGMTAGWGASTLIPSTSFE